MDTEKLETIRQFKEHQTPAAPEYESYISNLYDEKHAESFSGRITPFSLLQLLILCRVLIKYFT